MNVAPRVYTYFAFGAVEEGIKDQLRNVRVRNGIVSVLSLTPARHQSGVAETPEPFRNR